MSIRIRHIKNDVRRKQNTFHNHCNKHNYFKLPTIRTCQRNLGSNIFKRTIDNTARRYCVIFCYTRAAPKQMLVDCHRGRDNP